MRKTHVVVGMMVVIGAATVAQADFVRTFDFNWAGHHSDNLNDHSFWDRLVNTDNYARFRDTSLDTDVPAGSTDGWVAGARWYGVKGYQDYSYNRWVGADQGTFTAQEGYSYTVEAKVATNTINLGYTNLMADVRLAVAPVGSGYDDLTNYDQVAYFTRGTMDTSAAPLSAMEDGNQVGTTSGLSRRTWYDLKIVVDSLAGQADTASYYYKESASGTWNTVAEDVALTNDLDTVNQRNSVVLGVWFAYPSTDRYMYGYVDNVSLSETLIPEPATCLLVGIGLVGAAWRRRT